MTDDRVDLIQISQSVHGNVTHLHHNPFDIPDSSTNFFDGSRSNEKPLAPKGVPNERKTDHIATSTKVHGVSTNASRELIGRSYQQDEYATVTVTRICAEDAARVVVERDVDGKSWTMPGWLIRLILLEERKRAA